MLAEIRGALALLDQYYGRPASGAGLASAVVYVELLLEIAGPSIAAGKITNTGTAAFDCFLQHLLDGVGQFSHALLRDFTGA